MWLAVTAVTVLLQILYLLPQKILDVMFSFHHSVSSDALAIITL
jgi:hypothetical protein